MTLDDVLRGDLGAWRGLAPDETVAGLGARLGRLTGIRAAGAAQRGSRRYMVSVLERDEPPREIEAWVELGSQQIAILELDDPAVADLDGTLARLGSPDLVLADRRFVPDATVRDYVYPRRGIAVSIAEPFGDASHQGRRPIRLQLFAATTPEAYLTEIDRGDELSPKTHPRPESNQP
jgi:hypothetical protein